MELSLNNTEINKKTKTQKSKKPKSKIEEIEKSIDVIHNEEQNIEEIVLEKKENIILEEVINEDLDIQKDESIENIESDEKENINKIDDSNEKEEYLKKLDTIVECLTFVNDKNLKDLNLTKDFFSNVSTRYKKIIKLNNQMTTNLIDIMLKENLVSLKNKDSKQNKPKKVINKENLAINKLMTTYPEVLKFLKLDENAMVSRAQLIQNINAFVKKEKTENNPDIYVKGDNRCFNLIGELKVLFNFIKLKMLERGDLENESEFPNNISYRQIMKYLKYCFPEIKK